MRNNLADNTDAITGEVNLTSLAEDACEALDLYDPNYTIPEGLYEIAFDVVFPSEYPQYTEDTI
jgi:hypothetical protein